MSCATACIGASVAWESVRTCCVGGCRWVVAVRCYLGNKKPCDYCHRVVFVLVEVTLQVQWEVEEAAC